MYFRFDTVNNGLGEKVKLGQGPFLKRNSESNIYIEALGESFN